MRINIAKPLIDEDEITEVSRVMRSGMIASGPETKLFEDEFAKYVGAKYACATTNGTTALTLALLAAGVGPGDEVITTPFTFVATANAILSSGAIPVFADIDEDTFNLSPSSAESMITEKTKAIMPVHLYGLSANIIELRKITDKHNLALIGDAAQSHGAKCGDEFVGSLADMECFSFYPTKNMTTGEGGMITTNDETLFSLVNSIRNHGRPTSTLGTYEYDRYGLNMRLTDIGSAIGRVQLRKLTEFNSTRARNATLLSELLSNCDGIKLPIVPQGYKHVWHQYTIRVSDRASLSSYLRKNDIGSGSYYPRLIYEYPHLQQYKSDCPVAESLVDEVISLPVHAGLSTEEIKEVAECVKNWLIS